MEAYLVTGYKGTKGGWSTSEVVIEPTKVEALDSFDAASKIAKQYFGKTKKLFGRERPPETVGMFFETMQPKIVLHVEDLNILRPFRDRVQPLY